MCSKYNVNISTRTDFFQKKTDFNFYSRFLVAFTQEKSRFFEGRRTGFRAGLHKNCRKKNLLSKLCVYLSGKIILYIVIVMKKSLFIIAVAVLAVSFVSCGGNKSDANSAGTDTVAQLEETTPANVAAQTVFGKLREAGADPTKLRLAVGTAQAKIHELLQSGDTAAVKQYTAILSKLIAGSDDVKQALATATTATKGSLLDAFNSVVGAATKQGATAASFVEATKKAGTNALTEKAKELQEAVGDAEGALEEGGQAVEAAKEAVEKAPEAAKQAAQKALEDGKAQVTETAQKKVEEGRQKANEAVSKGVESGARKVNEAADRLKDRLIR